MKNSKLKFLLQYFETIVAAGFLVVTTVLVITNVFMRYVLNSGIVWSEEVATGCFVWTIFLGSAAAYKNGALIGVDTLVKRFPKSLYNVTTLIVQAILVVVNAVLTYLSCIYVSLSYTKMTPVMGVTSAWISSSLIVSFGLTTIYSFINLVKFVKNMNKKEEV